MSQTLHSPTPYTMSGPYKGHLAPKSSPFKPTVNKLSTQFLIQDHMANHYYKLLKAKPAIDSKLPKSYEKSTVKRDQVRRQMISNDIRKSKELQSSPQQYKINDNLYDSYQFSEDGRSLTSNSTYSLTKYHRHQLTPRPATAGTLGYSREFKSSSSPKYNETIDIRKKTYEGGDYLDRHKEFFKNSEQEPFTPRTKKRNNSKSKLKESRHYAPPLKLTKSKRNKSYSDKSHFDSGSENDANKTSKSLMNQSSTEGTQIKLAEDLERLEIKEKTSTKRDLLNTSGTGSPSQRHKSWATTARSITRFRRTSAERRALMQQLEEEDKEMKYLQFVNEVANEILTRGVYSDRVIVQTMERHIDRNRGTLDEIRMRQALIKLQRDLGIRLESSPYERGRESTYKSQNHQQSYSYQNREPIASARSEYPGNYSLPKPTRRRSRGSSVVSAGSTGSRRARGGKVSHASDSDVGSDVSGRRSILKKSGSSGDESIPRSGSERSLASVGSRSEDARSKEDEKSKSIDQSKPDESMRPKPDENVEVSEEHGSKIENKDDEHEPKSIDEKVSAEDNQNAKETKKEANKSEPEDQYDSDF